MSLFLELDDVLAMAEQIERDAASFYRQAASASSTPWCSQVLLGLASMEADHEHVFAGIRAQCSGAASGPAPGTGGWRFLTGYLSSGVQEALARRFSNHDSVEQILRKAIEFEKDSIVFLLSLKEAVPAGADAKQIDAVIREEIGHILTLAGQLTSPGPAPLSPERPSGPQDTPDGPPRGHLDPDPNEPTA